MEKDVFISHAHKDNSIAVAICGKLESAGLKCWTAARDISAREDWTEATRKAIESSRVMVVVLSENANAAPHIRREIAHASYMRRIIITFRSAETLPRREILFYLSNVPWFNSLNPPTEEHLEALTARIKGLIAGSAGAGNATPPQSQKKKTASLSAANSWFGALRASHYRTLGILKWVAVTSCLCAAVLFSWFALRQTKERGHWRRATGDLRTVLSASLRLHRLRRGETNWSQNRPPPLRVSACGRLQAVAPRLWFRDLRKHPSIRRQSGQPTRLPHRNATLPQGNELGNWLRSLVLVTHRP